MINNALTENKIGDYLLANYGFDFYSDSTDAETNMIEAIADMSDGRPITYALIDSLATDLGITRLSVEMTTLDRETAARFIRDELYVAEEGTIKDALRATLHLINSEGSPDDPHAQAILDDYGWHGRTATVICHHAHRTETAALKCSSSMIRSW